ncbi:T9SS type A sorting domain-containing protein [Riemerella columbina]|uniref:T9SS type A sorting domain-containing protein n=1 Tax=Riemerella columbina TaxID=103810 RepID=UPI00266FE2F8|nr:T9SS type A sorting domain-containing protein [Riemerella columbina]WKS95683.1 T9SS type A sorting domain-containing protein [Riemerella columbina]
MKKLLLVPSLLMALPLFSQNLITNPSLEEWNSDWYLGQQSFYPTTWGKADAIQSSDNPQDGSYCAELKLGKSLRFKSKTGIQGNQKYILSFYIHDTNPDRNIVYRLTWLDSSGYSLTSDTDVMERNQDGWIKIEREMTAPHNAVGFTLNINTNGGSSANDINGSMKVDLFSFEKKGNMGVREISAKEALMVVQNKVLHLTTAQKSTLKIINLNGQTLKTQTVNGTEKIDLNTLPKGMYIITLENQKGFYSKKITL